MLCAVPGLAGKGRPHGGIASDDMPLTLTAAMGYVDGMQNRADRIHAALSAALSPEALDVVDDSARHAGHAGAQAGGETHYNVRAVSIAFRGLGRVARHRLVNAALEGEFLSGLHALSLVLHTPDEAASA